VGGVCKPPIAGALVVLLGETALGVA